MSTVSSFRIHRPRVVSIGFFICGLGCLLFALPHFLTPVYMPGNDDTVDDGLCRDRTNSTSICDQDDNSSPSSLSSFLWFFIIARFCNGIGSAPLFNWGGTYMDDSVSRETFSLYIGIFYAMGIIGPAVAVIAGGYLLNVHTDFLSEEESGLTPDDPLWVGAWWVGYLFLGVLCFLVLIPISGYAWEIPGSGEIRKQKISEAYSIDTQDDIVKGDMDIKLSDLPHYIKLLLKNPVFVFLTLFQCCDSFIIAAFASFGPKYVENQFALEAGLAGALFGLVLLPAGLIGTVLGGWLVKRFHFACTDILKWETVQTILILVFSFILFLYCDPVQFAGVTAPYSDGNSNSEIFDDCNANCSCNDLLFDPVCSVNDLQYFSSCHAGCKSFQENENDVEFFNCSCINRYLNSSDNELTQATKGPCNTSSCWFVVLFFFLFFLEVWLFFSCSTMNISATIRCVPGPQRSLAIGTQWMCLRLLGSIPGPLLFGLAFDSACSLWSETCDQIGSCLYYESSDLSSRIFLICGSVKGASFVFIVIAWISYRRNKGKLKDSEMTCIVEEEEHKEAEKTITLEADHNALQGCITVTKL